MNMEFKQVKRINLGEQVFEQLRTMIEQGTWEKGEKIPSERELTQSLGVSHATVRQALQKLNAIGILETRVGEGSFVKELEAHNCLDMLRPDSKLNGKGWRDVIEFRDMLECFSVGLAVERGSEEELQELQENYEQMLENIGNLELYARLDAKFHFIIGKMTKNDMLIKSYEIMSTVLENSVKSQVDKVGTSRGVYYHGKLLEAIQNRDRDAAQKLMEEHTAQLYFNTFKDQKEELA